MRLNKEESLIIYGKRMMKHMPATVRELSAKLKVSSSVAKKTIAWLRDNKAAYISGWTKSGHADAPVYSEGCYTDAVRPVPPKRERAYVRKAKPEVLPFNLPARCIPKDTRITALLAENTIAYKSNWVGGNPFDSLRVVHSCSSADVAYVKK